MFKENNNVIDLEIAHYKSSQYKDAIKVFHRTIELLNKYLN